MQTSHVRSATIATLEREECVLETVIEKKATDFQKLKRKNLPSNYFNLDLFHF